MIIKNGIVLKQNDFEKERTLQNFFERYLNEILGFKYVASEFSVGGFRIDTVAFDCESKSFKIIEFKNIKNGSLIDQGYTYLKILLDRKADFVLKLNEMLNKSFRVDQIDWSASRVIFVSPAFTSYQLNATDFSDMPFDLFKVTRYEGDIVNIEKIEKTSKAIVNQISTSKMQKEVEKEIVVYNESDRLAIFPEQIQELYFEFKSRVTSLDDIDVEVKKHYIAFKGATNICDVEFQKKQLRVSINLKNGSLVVNDFIKSFAGKGHLGNGDYYAEIKKIEDIDKIMPYVRQSLSKNKK